MLKRGQSLSVNAIILIILGLVILVILILGFSLGWGNINPFISKDNVNSMATACELACLSGSESDYCDLERVLRFEGKSYQDTCQWFSEFGKTEMGGFDIPECYCPQGEIRKDVTPDNPLRSGQRAIITTFDDRIGSASVDENFEFEASFSPPFVIKLNPGETEVYCVDKKKGYAIEITSHNTNGEGVAYSYKKSEDGCSDINEEETSFFGNFSFFFNSIFPKKEVRSKEDLVYNALIYARDNKVYNSFNTPKNCVCGSNSNCKNYAKWIVRESTKRGIDDPLILVALMIQESSCVSNTASTHACYGLFQINVANACGKWGLPKNREECKNVLINNPEKNIEAGVALFKEKYNEFGGGIYESWPYRNVNSFKTMIHNCVQRYPKYGTYSGWLAALRGYNGWGCTTGADTDFVENIISIYNNLLMGI
ncbi:lytic transglycosylase domain-containing protein [Patescibacteria group bacterium]|nr:lytic transglycosylase domain-containing protein [Patescibacteria group bacterium]